MIIHAIRRSVLILRVLASWVTSIRAQEVTIPDPGLNAAIRDALGLPTGPLTQPDLLNLANLNARSRNGSSIVGPEAARNPASLDLEINQLTNFSLPSRFTQLITRRLCLARFHQPGGVGRPGRGDQSDRHRPLRRRTGWHRSADIFPGAVRAVTPYESEFKNAG